MSIRRSHSTSVGVASRFDTPTGSSAMAFRTTSKLTLAPSYFHPLSSSHTHPPPCRPAWSGHLRTISFVGDTSLAWVHSGRPAVNAQNHMSLCSLCIPSYRFDNALASSPLPSPSSPSSMSHIRRRLTISVVFVFVSNPARFHRHRPGGHHLPRLFRTPLPRSRHPLLPISDSSLLSFRCRRNTRFFLRRACSPPPPLVHDVHCHPTDDLEVASFCDDLLARNPAKDGNGDKRHGSKGDEADGEARAANDTTLTATATDIIAMKTFPPTVVPHHDAKGELSSFDSALQPKSDGHLHPLANVRLGTLCAMATRMDDQARVRALGRALDRGRRHRCQTGVDAENAAGEEKSGAGAAATASSDVSTQQQSGLRSRQDGGRRERGEEVDDDAEDVSTDEQRGIARLRLRDRDRQKTHYQDGDEEQQQEHEGVKIVSCLGERFAIADDFFATSPLGCAHGCFRAISGRPRGCL